MYDSLLKLAKKYGSVFTVYFGTKKVVVLAGYKTVQEALVRYPEEFGDRDISPITHDISHGHGITFICYSLIHRSCFLVPLYQ